MPLTECGLELYPEFFAETTIIIAKRGYGKSYTARVIIEEGIKNNNTFVVLDPQDAYLNLKEFFYIDAQKVKDAKKLGEIEAKTHRNVVIRLKRLLQNEQCLFLRDFLTEFKKHIQKGIQTIVIDEIHKFAPEKNTTECKDVVLSLFQENRSDGLGCIGITQRVARLDKTILSQADNLLLGKVNSYRDKEAVKNYIDNLEEIKIISNLNIGEFYIIGLNLDAPKKVKIRKAETEHSGFTPKNLLIEDKNTFNKYIKLVYKGGNMAEIENKNEIVDKIIPSVEGFKDLAVLGFKVSLGFAASGILSNFIGSMFKSPLPVVSSRTLAGLGSTIALYALYRNIDFEIAKDILKYATAGSAAFTMGSLAFDILGALNIQLPAIATTSISAATGALPPTTEFAENVDINTAFK